MDGGGGSDDGLGQGDLVIGDGGEGDADDGGLVSKPIQSSIQTVTVKFIPSCPSVLHASYSLTFLSYLRSRSRSPPCLSSRLHMAEGSEISISELR